MAAIGPPVIRDDLSSRLVHLTKGTPEKAVETFCAILKDQCLKAFPDGKKKSKHPRICFSEAPLSKLGHLIATGHPGFRYQYFGIIVDKAWLFKRGGRPVIYQPAAELELLDPSIRFRHATYDPLDIAKRDFTFEREWRIPQAELQFDPADVTLIVPTRAWSFQAREGRRAQVQRGMLVTRGFGGRAMTEDSWFFLVLEDLGIPISGALAPPDGWFPPSRRPGQAAERR
jgi:hypothetical protein